MLEEKDIEKLASLSRVGILEEEIEVLIKDLEAVLGYVSEIKEVVTGEVDPKAGNLRNVMRDDIDPQESGLFTENIMENVPEKKDGYIKVKKIL